jgi:hypothetical protein
MFSQSMNSIVGNSVVFGIQVPAPQIHLAKILSLRLHACLRASSFILSLTFSSEGL